MRRICKFLGIAFAASLMLVAGVNSSAVQAAGEGTKKGVQGFDFTRTENLDSLNVKHTLMNIRINDCISTSYGSNPITVGATTYYFTSAATAYANTISEMNKKGITVSYVVLMGWSDDPAIQKLIYPGARQPGHAYYALNTDSESSQVLSALFSYILGTFSSSDCHVDNWIIGNEVNMPQSYYYTGTLDTQQNANIYANEFLLFYNCMKKSGNSRAKAYISLDHSWTHNADGQGIAGKDYLNAFNSSLASKQANVDWNVAYHPYLASLDSNTVNSTLWYNPYTTNDENTEMITAANLSVLTNYLRNHFGSRRVILSEVGVDSSGSEGEQAAAVAYTYYAAENNSMVDAVIFRAYTDAAGEGALKLGFVKGYINELLNTTGDPTQFMQYLTSHKKKVYDVFKYMDTPSRSQYADPYLGFAGIKTWTEPVYYGADYVNKPVDYPTVYNNVDYRACYDKHFYYEANKDLQIAIGDNPQALLEHFVNFGSKEGRMSSPNFNVYIYKANYSDLRQIYGTDLSQYYWHYAVGGFAEKRNAMHITCAKDRKNSPLNAIFNGVDYSSEYNLYDYFYYNPDVRDLYGCNPNYLLAHYVNNGRAEGRKAIIKEKVAFYGGDVNGDGKINLSDTQIVLKIALGIKQASASEKKQADVSGDGAVNLSDAQLHLKAALGIVLI